MTKGKALIEARLLLGPMAEVRIGTGYPPCTVGKRDSYGFIGYGSGRTWEEALKAARRTA
jgi:hypothetical protein